MSKQPSRSAKRRPQARKGRTAVAAKTARKQTDRTAWIVAGGVIVVGVALVIAFAGGTKTSSDGFIDGDKAAPAALVAKVAGVKNDVINEVGQGSMSALPTKLDGEKLVTSGGKPRIVYIGANYCPYCATERWALVQALSRFGKFTNLRITSSAKLTQQNSPEVFPNTQTFSFHGTKYDSDYVQFESAETQTNKYKPLETPTDEQAALDAKYNAPPYTNSAGSIPFIDFANQFLISGASYDAGVLRDKSHNEIAAAMNDPSSEIAKGAVGTANAITATICKITDNKATEVCSQPAIKTIQAQLPTK